MVEEVPYNRLVKPTERKVSFESENLVVDYISFNITGSKDPEPIANYLFQNFSFNSTIFKKINYKWKSESLNYDRQNQFQVAFWQYEYHPEVKSFWEGTKVHFSGANAAQIYTIIQAKKFVERIKYQKDFWSNKTKVNEGILHIRPDAYLPKSPDNIFTQNQVENKQVLPKLAPFAKQW